MLNINSVAPIVPRRPAAGQRTVQDHPYLAAQWDSERNGGIKPEHVAEGSTYRAFWVCGGCGEGWRAAVQSRTGQSAHGCPFCHGGRIVHSSESLEAKFPGVAKEWDCEANSGLKAGDGSALVPRNCPPHSRKKVGWKHVGVGGVEHRWEQAVYSRTNLGQGCPECNPGGGPRWKENLMEGFPSVAAMWHPELNGGLAAGVCTPGSRKEVWWLCPEVSCEEHHPHVWKARVSSLVLAHLRGRSGCPFCSNAGAKVCACNSLQGKFPCLAAEFHPSKNLVLDRETGEERVVRADEVPPRSAVKRWWCCRVCGFGWEATPHDRTRIRKPSGCPRCNPPGRTRNLI